MFCFFFVSVLGIKPKVSCVFSVLILSYILSQKNLILIINKISTSSLKFHRSSLFKMNKLLIGTHADTSHSRRNLTYKNACSMA